MVAFLLVFTQKGDWPLIGSSYHFIGLRKKSKMHILKLKVQVEISAQFYVGAIPLHPQLCRRRREGTQTRARYNFFEIGWPLI